MSRRCARHGRARYPDPVHAALLAEQSGADNITLHLREDRRHIQDADVTALAGLLQTRMNLEMANTPEMVAIAARLRPADCCLVPERRAEITTEGGLDVAGNAAALRSSCTTLAAAGVRVALFIDPDRAQVEATARAGAPVVELHTGQYAERAGRRRGARTRASARCRAPRRAARPRGTCGPWPQLPQRPAGRGDPAGSSSSTSATRSWRAPVFAGLEAAVREMKTLMLAARR